MDCADYVIVGAGAAGCVLAERLTRDPRRSVILIEAGPMDRNPFFHMPMGSGRVLGDPRYMWYYPTLPDEGSAHRSMIWPRGRVLGGSTSVNGMVYCRGHPQDYEDWVSAGATGWGWSAMSAAFRAIEDHELGDDGERGTGGPVRVTTRSYRSPLTEALLRAGADLGTPSREDLNHLGAPGIGYAPKTIRNGRRESAATAFLRRARRRPNLRILTDTMAFRLRFEGQRATGIETSRGTFDARREVILSAGAIETPLLLQRSGIGPARHLAGLGVPVIADHPHVGAHLKDHKLMNMVLRLSRPYSHNVSLSGPRLAANALRYVLTRGGPLATSIDMAAFIPMQEGSVRADAQAIIWSLSLKPGGEAMALEKQPGMWASVFVLRPRSEGSIMLSSPDPGGAPMIRPNFLADAHDRAVLVNGFNYLRRLFAHPQVAPFILSEAHPGQVVQSDDDIIAAARQDDTMAHAAGTCRMGRAGEGALDERLRLRGCGGVRVVDLSVVPSHVSGNPAGPVMAIAWHAATLIEEDERRGAA